MQLVAEFPEFVPYFSACYDAPAELIYGDQTIPAEQSQHGCQQGCSLADVLQLIGAHERSDESGSDSSGEESDVPSPTQDSDGPVVPQPTTRAAARRRQRLRQSIDLADALAHSQRSLVFVVCFHSRGVAPAHVFVSWFFNKLRRLSDHRLLTMVL